MATVGRGARRKGHDFERHVAQLFRRWFPDARRGLQYQDGEHCPDVQGTPFYVECKRYAKYLPLCSQKIWTGAYQRMAQWRNNGGKDCEPLVIYKLDRRLVRVCMAASVAQDIGIKGVILYTGIWCITWSDFAAALDKIYPIKESR
ncbi:MAG: hypothetical protein ACYTEQ_27340 [Planctomycetota bacterium]|jgi:hypothetical protein